MRTGNSYLNSLNEGREVVIEGEVVKDVAAHPAFSGVCQTVADLYDFIDANREEMAFESPTTGQPVSTCAT